MMSSRPDARARFVAFQRLASAPRRRPEDVVRIVVPAMPSRPLPDHSPPPPPPEAKPARAAPPPPPEPMGPAPEELEALLSGAREEGAAAAMAAMAADMAAGEARLEAERARLSRLLLEIEAQREGWQAELEVAAGELCLLATRRLVGRIPELMDALLRARLAEVLEHMVRASDVVLRVAPGDLESARAFIERANTRFPWTVIADDGVSGGCVAEGSSGTMDASLDAGLSGLDEALAAWRAERGLPAKGASR